MRYVGSGRYRVIIRPDDGDANIGDDTSVNVVSVRSCNVSLDESKVDEEKERKLLGRVKSKHG